MSVNRRVFMRQVIAVGPVTMAFFIESDAFGAECGKPLIGPGDCTLPRPPTPERFIPNEPKVRLRLTARDLADPSRASQLKAFRDAICLVRNLPPDNVTSWTKFVATHCVNCASSNTNNIHYNWQFLPWHRGLLYFLERLLRKLGKNDDIRLPYWDWENSASRTLPSIYAPKDQPLYWANRNLTGPSWPLSNPDVNVQPLLAIPNFATFGGTATQRRPVPAVYSGPHANVHNAFYPGDMSNLQYSPRDPVFYAHHGNIDRLWASWAALHTVPDFGDARVFFYDENGKWRYVLFNDLRDEKKLGYQYSTLMKPTSTKLKSFPTPMQKNRIALSAPMMAAVNDTTPEFLIISNIQNLDKLPPATVEFGIFSGNPPVGTDSATSPNFLGTASRVLSAGHDHPADPLSTALDVTDKLGKMASPNKGAVDLFVAPLNPAGKTTAPAIPLVADSINLIG
jgi:polyphenol oxidase